MVRKSFDIREVDLDNAKRNAEAHGISVAEYLREAVIARNTGASTTQSIEAATAKLNGLIDRLDREMTQLRLDLVSQEEASGRAFMAMHEQAINENRTLMVKAIDTLGRHISSILDPQESSTSSGTHGHGTNGIATGMPYTPHRHRD